MRLRRIVVFCVTCVFGIVLHQISTVSPWAINLQKDHEKTVEFGAVLSSRIVSNQTLVIASLKSGNTSWSRGALGSTGTSPSRGTKTTAERRKHTKNKGKRTRRDSGKVARLNRTRSYVPPPAVNMSLVLLRVYDSWPQNRSLPCYAPEDNWHSSTVARSRSDTGFLFIKPMKTGGSTAAGVHLRIARHVARRQNETFDLCKGRWDHAWASQMVSNRIPEKSFLWTMVRDPTKRAVSQYFHFKVSRENASTSDQAFQQHLRSDKLYWNYYLRYLSTEQVIVNPKTAYDVINKILSGYDFIAVTERFDESMVCLMMLLDLRLADILYLSAKGNGNYDDGAQDSTCYYIQPSVVSPGMKAFFEDRQWQANVRWDTLLHQAANRSLDVTIDRLGRSIFEATLVKFRKAQAVAKERCLPREVFPCTSHGVNQQNQTLCIWADSGCGSDCLDEVATELDLW